jgi:hypothetical protein
MKVLNVVKLLNERLKCLDNSTQSAELGVLARAVAALTKLETIDDVLALGDEKITEISGSAAQKFEELDATREANQADLSVAKSGALSSISNAESGGENAISQCIEEKRNAFNDFVDDFKAVNDVPEGSTIGAEISECLGSADFLKTKNLPFIFGILSRNDDLGSGYGVGYYTTAFSGPVSASAARADGVFSLLIGAHNYTTENAAFYREPKLRFLQGANGNFIFRELYTTYQIGTSYMREAVGAMFVRNATSENIATTLNFGGSGESTATYGGLGAMIGVPNFESETIAWTSAYSTGGTSGVSTSASVTIPADTTVVILPCSTSYYIASGDGCYFKVLHWQMNQIRSAFLREGLEIYLKKTLKAWQHPGFENAFDIFQPEAGLEN